MSLVLGDYGRVGRDGKCIALSIMGAVNECLNQSACPLALFGGIPTPHNLLVFKQQQTFNAADETERPTMRLSKGKMKRREFFKASVAASAVISCSAGAATAAERPRGGKQEYYELRAYRLKAGADNEMLESYLEKALVPALNRLKVKPVGVFREEEPKEGDKIWMLMAYPS